MDEWKALGEGHYQLYFDANGDHDLTNDPVLERMKDPPPGAELPWKSKKMAVFDYLEVPFDFGPELGKRPVRMMPRLAADEYEGKEYASLGFVPTMARRGTIRIGTHEYKVVLGSAYMVLGRLDGPWTGLHLTPVGAPDSREQWQGADRLSGMRHVDGRWYRLAATPTGDKLIVRPYQGDLGVFEVGPGKRKLDKMLISGSLRSKDTAVPVGDLTRISYRAEPARRCTLPVGDYTLDFTHVEYGPLSIFMSNNYHADGKPRGGIERPTIYGVKIRKDKPFVLDFSNEPEVMFASPAKDQSFKPGDEVKVAAVLIDPVLDVMIRNLNAAEPVKEEKEKKEGDKDAAKKDGNLVEAVVKALGGTKSDPPAAPPPARLSLDPTVTITDSSGKEVSRGKMPFG